MTEWFTIVQDIREARELIENDGAEAPAPYNTMLRTLTIMHRMALAMEMQRNAPSPRASLDELRMRTLAMRLDSFECDVLDIRALCRRIEKRLDAIEQRLPEPPQGFDG